MTATTTVIDRNQLAKLVRDTPTNQMMLLNTSALQKDSVKQMLTNLQKFTSNKSDYIVIAIRG
jgi:hypothetical protein